MLARQPVAPLVGTGKKRLFLSRRCRLLCFPRPVSPGLATDRRKLGRWALPTGSAELSGLVSALFLWLCFFLLSLWFLFFFARVLLESSLVARVCRQGEPGARRKGDNRAPKRCDPGRGGSCRPKGVTFVSFKCRVSCYVCRLPSWASLHHPPLLVRFYVRYHRSTLAYWSTGVCHASVCFRINDLFYFYFIFIFLLVFFRSDQQLFLRSRYHPNQQQASFFGLSPSLFAYWSSTRIGLSHARTQTPGTHHGCLCTEHGRSLRGCCCTLLPQIGCYVVLGVTAVDICSTCPVLCAHGVEKPSC